MKIENTRLYLATAYGDFKLKDYSMWREYQIAISADRKEVGFFTSSVKKAVRSLKGYKVDYFILKGKKYDKNGKRIA